MRLSSKANARFYLNSAAMTECGRLRVGGRRVVRALDFAGNPAGFGQMPMANAALAAHSGML
jgi:hypothetical protein